MDDIIKANNRNLGRYDNVGFEHQNNDELFNELVVEEDDVDFESEEMQALHFTSNKALGRIDSSENMVETPPMESPVSDDGATEINGYKTAISEDAQATGETQNDTSHSPGQYEDQEIQETDLAAMRSNHKSLGLKSLSL